MVQVITHAARGFIPMMELIDREKELARLNKEKAGAEKEIGMFSRQLSNEGFVNKAPANVVEEIRQKDREKELARLNKEKAGAEKEIGMFSRQLSNEGFVNKAPANVVEEIRQKLARAQEKLARVEESIAALG